MSRIGTIRKPYETSPDCPQQILLPAVLWPEIASCLRSQDLPNHGSSKFSNNKEPKEPSPTEPPSPIMSAAVQDRPLVAVVAPKSVYLTKRGPPGSENAKHADVADFRKFFAKAKHIVVISGAGISAESGIPTFRGAGGYWRRWQSQALATPEAFAQNPSLVWEFYHYRREVIQRVEPNPGHFAIAKCEARLREQGRRVTVITQNIDELHRKAGTKNLLEIHGSIFKTRCTSCGVVAENYKSPICAALSGKGAPEPEAQDARIPVEKLPRCEEAGCGGLLRPYVVWFGENLDPAILEEVDRELALCDLCLVVGTSSVVYPAAMFAPQVSARGVPVAEFNMETTPATNRFRFHFQGPCGTTLPEALAPHETETVS